MKILLFLLCLLPWFASSFVQIDPEFYNSLTLPFFSPPQATFGIVWTIIYILIAIGLFLTVKDYKWDEIPKGFKLALLINYLFNQSFPIFFFILKSPFLGFISSLGTFISSLFLYEEANKLNENSVKYFNPYILWNLFATILSLTIYVLNAN